MTKFGTFEELVESKPPGIQQLSRLLRDLVEDIDPDTVEVVRLGDNAACYGVGPKKMSEAYCYIMPRLDYVNLGFFRADQLNDPAGLLEGTGKRMRHVKIYFDEDSERPALRDLIVQSLEERKRALGL